MNSFYLLNFIWCAHLLYSFCFVLQLLFKEFIWFPFNIFKGKFCLEIWIDSLHYWEIKVGFAFFLHIVLCCCCTAWLLHESRYVSLHVHLHVTQHAGFTSMSPTGFVCIVKERALCFCHVWSVCVCCTVSLLWCSASGLIWVKNLTVANLVKFLGTVTSFLSSFSVDLLVCISATSYIAVTEWFLGSFERRIQFEILVFVVLEQKLYNLFTLEPRSSQKSAFVNWLTS